MVQHDKRFKRFVQEFLREIVVWRRPNWSVLIDWNQIVWRQQELVADLTVGESQVIDLVAHLRVTAAAQTVTGAPGPAGFWLHTELEGRDALGVFTVRMARYQEWLRAEAAPAPVLSLAVLRHLQLNGVGYVDTTHASRVRGLVAPHTLCVFRLARAERRRPFGERQPRGRRLVGADALA
jgi:hypothetical protein